MLQKNSRRDFIKQAGAAAALLAIGQYPTDVFGGNTVKIKILHTNDVHSRLEPFPANAGKLSNLGGVKNRMALIEKIRAASKNVLLFDCGDLFQGTPYFNYFKGEPEVKAMSLMGYDACTMGNHDFDAGVDNFANQLKHANFPVLCANYDFSQTLLAEKTQPYKVFIKQGVKIGVFGLGIELDGLVASNLYGNTKYLDPIETAKAMVKKLREEENCDAIVCLSHLGYKYDSSKISDIVLAQKVSGIDVILGGHTHTFMEKPEFISNQNHLTLIHQVGWAGVWLGEIELTVEKHKNKPQISAKKHQIN